MLLNELKLGRPLEIYINRDGYNYRIVSKIEYTESGCVCVTLIANGTRVFQFLDTDVVDIVYQEHDHMWKWHDIKGAVVNVGDDKLHGFFSEEQGENYNRRNAFRLYVGIEQNINYMVRETKKAPLAADESIKSKTVYNYDKTSDRISEDCFRWIECQAFIRDISEIGVGIYTNQKFMPEDEIEFTLETNFGKINCRAVIVRMREHNNGSFSYYYGCRFVECSRSLTKYLYEQQRLQIQNANGSNYKNREQ